MGKNAFLVIKCIFEGKWPLFFTHDKDGLDALVQLAGPVLGQDLRCDVPSHPQPPDQESRQEQRAQDANTQTVALLPAAEIRRRRKKEKKTESQKEDKHNQLTAYFLTIKVLSKYVHKLAAPKHKCQTEKASIASASQRKRTKKNPATNK